MGSMTHKEKDALIQELKLKIEELESDSGTPEQRDLKLTLGACLEAVPKGDPVKQRRIKNLIKKAITKL